MSDYDPDLEMAWREREMLVRFLSDRIARAEAHMPEMTGNNRRRLRAEIGETRAILEAVVRRRHHAF